MGQRSIELPVADNNSVKRMLASKCSLLTLRAIPTVGPLGQGKVPTAEFQCTPEIVLSHDALGVTLLWDGKPLFISWANVAALVAT